MMKRFFHLLLILLCLSGVSALKAQTKTDVSNYSITEKGILKTAVIDGEQVTYTVFKPEIIFKGKYEVLTTNGDQRFSIRNSRVGFVGGITPKLSYKFLLDLSGNGSFSVLDLYMKFAPTKRLSISFGQLGLPIFNSYTISPASLDFANRPFVGKFFTSTREIGINALYVLKNEGFPITAELGFYNGEGINKAEWSLTPAYAARFAFGSLKEGFRTTIKGFRIKSTEEKNYYIYGADFRYLKNSLTLETEFLNRFNDYSNSNMFSYYAQVLYCFNVDESDWLKGVEPAVRWEQIGDDAYDKGFGISRLTTGLNFDLKTGKFKTIFRINYEHFIKTKDVAAITVKQDRTNKVTAEINFAF